MRRILTALVAVLILSGIGAVMAQEKKPEFDSWIDKQKGKWVDKCGYVHTPMSEGTCKSKYPLYDKEECQQLCTPVTDTDEPKAGASQEEAKVDVNIYVNGVATATAKAEGSHIMVTVNVTGPPETEKPQEEGKKTTTDEEAHPTVDMSTTGRLDLNALFLPARGYEEPPKLPWRWGGGVSVFAGFDARALGLNLFALSPETKWLFGAHALYGDKEGVSESLHLVKIRERERTYPNGTEEYWRCVLMKDVFRKDPDGKDWGGLFYFDRVFNPPK